MKSLLVVAGEDSGDLHGAEILKSLRARHPDLRVIGIGGDRMSPLLDRRLAHVRDLGVVGYVEIIRHLPRLRRLFRELLAVVAEEEVGTVLLIDYPGFNMRLARALKAFPRPPRVHQYVCPQVWAWKAGRIPQLGRTLDTLYCLFEFEPALFRGHPVEALWVGNLLGDLVAPEVDRRTFFAEAGLDPGRPLVALLPGSRAGEIHRLLGPMLGLVRAWQGDPVHAGVQWVLPTAPSLDAEDLRRRVGPLPVRVLEGRGYAARAHAEAALVCSGTATLETALLGTPFAVVYRLNPLTYLAARRVVKLPHFALANVVAGRGVVPELVQGEVNPRRLAQELERLLDPATATRMRADLSEIRARLGPPGAADRVAAHLLDSAATER